MKLKTLLISLCILALCLTGCTLTAPHEGQADYTQEPLPFTPMEDILPTPEPIVPIVTPEPPKPFSMEDMVIAGIASGCSTEDVIAAVGTTDKIEKSKENDQFMETWTYEDLGLVVVFTGELEDDLFVHSVTLNGETGEGPRGIKIGDTYEAVIASFPQDEHRLDPNGDVILYADEVLADGYPLPPCAVLKGAYNGEQILMFYESIVPYEGTITKREQYKDALHAILVIRFNQGIVTGMEYTIDPIK
ncbi:MAG: hypothetical protein II781_03680 [Clostridia bacterium]|nr:hypothetical protein [Clostridia bacterium]